MRVGARESGRRRDGLVGGSQAGGLLARGPCRPHVRHDPILDWVGSNRAKCPLRHLVHRWAAEDAFSVHSRLKNGASSVVQSSICDSGPLLMLTRIAGTIGAIRIEFDKVFVNDSDRRSPHIWLKRAHARADDDCSAIDRRRQTPGPHITCNAHLAAVHRGTCSPVAAARGDQLLRELGALAR